LFSFTSVRHHPSVRQLGLRSYGLCLSSAADSDHRFQRHLLLLHSLKIGNTMNFINCILDLTDSDFFTEESISEALKTEARSMAGLDPEEFYID
jgi:hypothetical protein